MRVTVPTLEHDVPEMLQRLFGRAARRGVSVRQHAHPGGGEFIVIEGGPGTAEIRVLVEDAVPVIRLAVGVHTRFELQLEGNWTHDRKTLSLFLAIVQGVVAGGLEERLWYRRGSIAKSRSTLWTTSFGRVVVSDMTGGLIWTFPRGRSPTVFRYAPWGVDLEDVVLDPG